MANNRLHIYCKKCWSFEPIAKYYPTEWYCNDAFHNPIHGFLTSHSESCWQNQTEADHAFGTHMFGFRTEMEHDEFIADYEKRKLFRKGEQHALIESP